MAENKNRPLSFSSISTYRTCPQKYRLRYIERLERVPTSEAKEAPREMGTWWHAVRAAEAIERGRVRDSLVAEGVPETLQLADDWPELSTDSEHLVDAVFEQMDAWWKDRSPDYREAFIEQFRQDMPSRLDYMLDAWTARYSAELEVRNPLAVEFKFERDLTQDGDMKIRGVVDEIFLDTSKNIVVVSDNKGHREIPRESSRTEMSESQLHLYAWAVAATVAQWGHGEPRALAYDRARFKAPATPQVTATGGLSKSVTDYDHQTYVEWASQSPKWGKPGEYVKTGKNAGRAKFGTYELEESVAERLLESQELDKWFKSSRVPVNINAVRTHLVAAKYSGDGIAQVVEQATSPEEVVPMNLGKACDWCEFSQLCRSVIFGGVKGDYDLESLGLRRRAEPSEDAEAEGDPVDTVEDLEV